jgi:hypothetical protein
MFFIATMLHPIVQTSLYYGRTNYRFLDVPVLLMETCYSPDGHSLAMTWACPVCLRQHQQSGCMLLQPYPLGRVKQ